MPHARPRHLVAVVVFGLAFVVNPGYVAGCGSDESEPEFGEEEMLDLLDEANAMGPWQFEHEGTPYEVELALLQKEGEDVLATRPRPGFAQQAHACSNRTFMQAASACVTVTTVPLEATLTLRRTDEEPAVEIASEVMDAQLRAFGLTLASALLEVGSFPPAVVLSTTDGRRFELASVYGPALGAAAMHIDYVKD